MLAGQIATTPMPMHWINYSYVFAGFNLCNNATGVCRSLGHWVYSISPAELTHSVVSGASVSIDGGAWSAAQPGNFEAHICNGQCGNTSDAGSCEFYTDAATGGEQLAQVWNWGFDSIVLYDAAPAAVGGGGGTGGGTGGSAAAVARPSHSSSVIPMAAVARPTSASITWGAAMATMPRKVCIKAWALNENTGERGELPAACNDFPLTTFGAPLAQEAWVASFLYSLSAEVATHMCTAAFCRTNAHNSWDVSVPDPTNVLVAATEYAIDGGAWSSASGLTFFEQKVKHVVTDTADEWYHTFSWNYDVLAQPGTPAPAQICFRAWAQNRVSGETAWLDFGKYAQPGRPTTERCIKFCDHAMPFSYAPEAGGYCAPKP
jgi:hypothetical protein